jgi:hypothetical protein
VLFVVADLAELMSLPSVSIMMIFMDDDGEAVIEHETPVGDVDVSYFFGRSGLGGSGLRRTGHERHRENDEDCKLYPH